MLLPAALCLTLFLVAGGQVVDKAANSMVDDIFKIMYLKLTNIDFEPQPVSPFEIKRKVLGPDSQSFTAKFIQGRMTRFGFMNRKGDCQKTSNGDESSISCRISICGIGTVNFLTEFEMRDGEDVQNIKFESRVEDGSFSVEFRGPKGQPARLTSLEVLPITLTHISTLGAITLDKVSQEKFVAEMHDNLIGQLGTILRGKYMEALRDFSKSFEMA